MNKHLPALAATCAALALMAAMLPGCTTAQLATANKYQSDVAAACSVAKAAMSDPLAVAAMGAVPAVAQAANLVQASCNTEEAVASLVVSPTSVAWLGTLTTTLKTGGKVVLPPPVAP